MPGIRHAERHDRTSQKNEGTKAGTASYQGGRMPLSGYLAEVMRKQLHEAEELAGTYMRNMLCWLLYWTCSGTGQPFRSR